MNSILGAKLKEFRRDNPIEKSYSFVKIAAILVIVFLLIISGNSLMEYSEMVQENEALEAEIEKTAERVGELKYRITIPHDDPDFIAFVAKEKLGLVFPEEIIFTGQTTIGE